MKTGEREDRKLNLNSGDSFTMGLAHMVLTMGLHRLQWRRK